MSDTSAEPAPTPKEYVQEILVNLSRRRKQSILMLSDAIILSAGMWVAMALRYGMLDFPTGERLDGLYFFLPLAGIACYWVLGLYGTMLRAMDFRTYLVILIGAAVMGLSITTWSFFDVKMEVPRSVPIIYILCVSLTIGLLRVIAREIYQLLTSTREDQQRIIVYGAGELGRRIVKLLQSTPQYRVVGIVDDNPKLRGTKIHGLRIRNTVDLEDVTSRYDVHQIAIAINSISSIRQREIVKSLIPLGISIKVIPGLSEFLERGGSFANLQPVRIEDLLGRQAVEPMTEFIESNFAGKNVLITGAAGSIGSEIFRQLMAGEPASIVALDVSEFNLYQFDKDVVSEFVGSKTVVHCKLGSVMDRQRIRRLLERYKIDIVYHTAAYKHVPIVEDNALAAVNNNIMGTRIAAEEAVAYGVSHFVLISTDKAVRPTNVMGATKRFSEFVVQNLQESAENTTLSMVRFGNVLGSSGSVIPLFRAQIAAGGPVTLTHKEVTRYFMTVSEAAQLVIQAGFIAKGGDVFVLDMGEPVRLIDMAHLMVQLSGFHVLEKGSSGPGIEIKEIGLRAGEKLYEELLVGDNAVGTQHPKIMRAVEKKLDEKTLKQALKQFEKSIETGDTVSAVALLKKHAELVNEAAASTQ